MKRFIKSVRLSAKERRILRYLCATPIPVVDKVMAQVVCGCGSRVGERLFSWGLVTIRVPGRGDIYAEATPLGTIANVDGSWFEERTR